MLATYTCLKQGPLQCVNKKIWISNKLGLKDLNKRLRTRQLLLKN